MAADSSQLFEGKKLRCLNQQLLSKGGYGSVVYRGFWKVDNNSKEEIEVAVRRIKVTDCAEKWKYVADELAKPELSQQNVLKIIGVEEDDADPQSRYFALELYGATLHQLCNNHYNGPMPSDAQVLFQIASGINHLHDKRLHHGNLNPSTILISQSEPVSIKVSEFGLHKFFNCSTSDQKQRSEIDQIESRLDSANISVRTNVYQESLSHPKYWMRSKNFESLPIDSEGKRLIVRASVHEDMFAAGCLFFYYLKRGSHPFGEVKSIMANISAKDPVNLKELKKDHFAFEVIENLIGDPPTDGEQWLRIAAYNFKGVLPLIN